MLLPISAECHLHVPNPAAHCHMQHMLATHCGPTPSCPADTLHSQPSAHIHFGPLARFSHLDGLHLAVHMAPWTRACGSSCRRKACDLQVGHLQVCSIHTPSHTLGHIAPAAVHSHT